MSEIPVRPSSEILVDISQRSRLAWVIARSQHIPKLDPTIVEGFIVNEALPASKGWRMLHEYASVITGLHVSIAPDNLLYLTTKVTATMKSVMYFPYMIVARSAQSCIQFVDSVSTCKAGNYRRCSNICGLLFAI